jgi:hypothetical protein
MENTYAWYQKNHTIILKIDAGLISPEQLASIDNSMSSLRNEAKLENHYDVDCGFNLAMVCITYTMRKKSCATTLKLAKGQYRITLVRYLKDIQLNDWGVHQTVHPVLWFIYLREMHLTVLCKAKQIRQLTDA